MRVIAEEADVHTGPGFGFRSIYVAKRGEVLPAIGRATHDHWFRVQLPDGTYGWILGDEVFPLDVDTVGGPRRPVDLEAHGRRGLLPLAAGRGDASSFTFSAGVLGGDGMFLFRPAVAAGPARLARGLRRRDRRQPGRRPLLRAAASTPSCSPTSPVTPFVAGAAGGAFGRKKADQFAIQTGNYAMVNVGGGLVSRSRSASRCAATSATTSSSTPTTPNKSRSTPVLSQSFSRSFLIAVPRARVPRRAGCAASKWTVKPHQRELLADRIMQLDGDAQERSAEEHVLSNREGAIGGTGTSGGGCGCN